MHYWIIDTSDENLLLRSFSSAGEFSLTLPPNEKCSEHLNDLLQKMLRMYGKPDAIAVGNGPGMFTGIRLGVMAAKTLSYAWNIPLIPFCSLKKYLPKTPGKFMVVRTADRRHAYCLEGYLTEENSLIWSKPAEKKPLSYLQDVTIPLIGFHRSLENLGAYEIGTLGIISLLKNPSFQTHETLDIDYLYQP